MAARLARFSVALLAVALAACGEAEGPGSSAWAPPPRLAEAGLFSDITNKVVASAAIGFQPAYALWSDGADKQRWVVLPEGGAIDSSDPDHWRFPVGSRFFKEFSQSGRRLETRLIERFGPGDGDYGMVA